MLDDIDRGILEALQGDAKLAQSQIAAAVGLSTPAVNERIRKLEQAGVIQRYVALVDPRALGADVTAFVEVFVEHPRFEDDFIDAVTAVPEVQEVHHVTGEFSLMLKVRTASIDTLRTLLMDTINAIAGVRQTRTVIVLATAKEETRIAIRTNGATPVRSRAAGHARRQTISQQERST